MKTTKSKTANTRAKAPAKKAATKPAAKKSDKNSKDKLPGEYSPKEDIMNQNDKSERVHVDLDNLSLSRATSDELLEDSEKRPLSRTAPKHSGKSSKKESDLTKEDYEALGPKDLSMDGGDDEQLKHRRWPVDFAARDLDIPGSELDDDSEKRGSEDEENNSYSLGGENHEDLEESKRG